MKAPVLFVSHGAPTFALLLQRAGFEVTLDHMRGFDHGAWVPLRHMFPDATTPLIQVSMPRDLDAKGAFDLGRALAPLRDSGVLIVGSGSLTHNLHEFAARTATSARYAEEFARWVRAAVIGKDTESLLSYRSEAPHAEGAHPTEEHFLPLLVALGAASDADDVIAIDGGMTYGVLSMDSFAWGVGTFGSAHRSRVRQVTDAKDLSDDAVAAICHPLQFCSPQVPL